MKKPERILLHASNLWYLGEGMLGPLFAVYTERIGGDILDITWAWAIFLIISGALSIYFGKLADNYNTEKVMIIGYALNAIFTFGYLFVATPAHLFLVQIGLGIASAMATPSWNALYDKYSSRKSKGLIWGLASGQADLLTGVAIIIGGFIVANYSFKVLFITMGSIQLIATLYQATILKKRNILKDTFKKIKD